MNEKKHVFLFAYLNEKIPIRSAFISYVYIYNKLQYIYTYDMNANCNICRYFYCTCMVIGTKNEYLVNGEENDKEQFDLNFASVKRVWRLI